jgi:hypothetical protein
MTGLRSSALCVLAAALGALAVAPAAGASDSHVDGRCSRAATSFNQTNATGPASSGYPLSGWNGLPFALVDPPPSGTAALSAHADASTRAMHALAYVATETGAPANDCTVNTRIRDTVTVLPGPGLSAGDAVRLVLKPGFHAQFSQGPSGTAQAPGPSLTSVDAFASVALKPIPPVGCVPREGGPDCFPDPAASFSASVRRTVDAGSTPSDPDGSLTVDSRWSWELHSNISPDDGDSAQGFAEICHAWPECHIAVTDPELAPLKPLDLSTGQRAIAFEVKVGEPISVDARLNALVQVFGSPASSGADMLRTLEYSLAPAPGYEGVTISYESQGAGGATDTTSPTIECGSADGAWHAQNVSIACTASDSGSGLANAGDAAFELATGVAAGAETADASTGSREVCDKAGNCAVAGPIAANRVDRRAPLLVLPADRAVNATAPAGAVVTYAVSATDGADPSPQVSCSPASGVVFPIGQTTVRCTARDHVGNEATGTFVVSVKGAKEQLGELIQKVISSSRLSPAVKSLLLARLQPLVAAFDPSKAVQRQAVCLALQVFKTLAPEWAPDANRIRAVLGC